MTETLDTDSFKREGSRTKQSGHSNHSSRQRYRYQKKEYRQLIFLHAREFHRTLSEVVCRSLLLIPCRQERHSEEQSAAQPLLSVLRIVRYPAYAKQTHIYDRFSRREAFHSIFSLALQVLYMHFSCINTVHLIFVPHLKLFSICDVTAPTQSSATICHAPSLAQARPHDAMHLPSCIKLALCNRQFVVLHSGAFVWSTSQHQKD